MKRSRHVAALGALLAVTMAFSATGATRVSAAPGSGGTLPRHPSITLDPAFADMPIDIIPDRFDEPASDVPEFGPTTGSEVTLTGADDWHTAGVTGAGVRVGVIDFFDVPLYWDTAESGPLPVAGVTARCIALGSDCTNFLFDGVDDGGEDHGVAVAEIVKDMAPDAEIYIGTALTPNDYISLIDWFASVGVTVVNRSLGSRYDGPGDGRGVMNDVAAYAVSRGITWINSGGNNGRDRYYRQPVRLSGANVAFGAAGNSTFMRFIGCAAPGGIRWVNDWNKAPAQRTDFDAYIWDSPTGSPGTGTIVAVANDDQRGGAPPVENFADDYCPTSSSQSLYLEIRWRGGDITNDVLEILDYGNGLATSTQVQFSASTSIVDSKLSGVVAVGAVEPAGLGTVAFYSSQGPTNDNRIAPDISAPSGFFSSTFGSTFSGTSASSPVVAGGAALLRSAGLANDPSALGDLIRHASADRGPVGPDSVYGYGEFTLPAPPTAINTNPSQFVALSAPRRILDTRPASATGPAELIGPVAPGDIRDLPVLGTAGIPASGVSAVAVNITAVEFDRPAYVQALPTTAAAVAGYSNLNIDAPGQTRANFAIVPVGSSGSISLYSTGGGNLVVDVLGYFQASGGPVAAGRFVELPVPDRVLDTRDGSGPMGGLQPRAVPFPASVDINQAAALVVTVTGTRASQPGWIQAFPSDRPDVIDTTSTVNLMQNQSVANTAIVPIGGGGISLTGFFGPGSGDAIVDVIGYITSGSAPVSDTGQFVTVRPARAFDSRLTTGELAVGQEVLVDAGAAPGTAVPPTATGVVWNIAALGVHQPGFGRAWRGDAAQPATSAFNWSAAGETRAAAVISAVDDRRARFVMFDGSGNPSVVAGGLVADVFGYFT